MDKKYKNFVFSGGGMWGIAYIGLIQYLDEIGLMQEIERVAGVSVGAITACLTSFNLPFLSLKEIANSLDYREVLQQDNKDTDKLLSRAMKNSFNKMFDNVDCVARLLKSYGWYSTEYIYEWLKMQIASQFDETKKAPPYTFADFRDSSLHKDNRVFKDLYIVSTDVSNETSILFSYETTPDMEVAQAVRASMSVPILFEAAQLDAPPSNTLSYFSDGGVMYNYPIDLFDYFCPKEETLGALFQSKQQKADIKNLFDFVGSLIDCIGKLQWAIYNTPENNARTILVPTGTLKSLDFNIEPNGVIYNFLYIQGYDSGKRFFTKNVNEKDSPV